MSRAAIAIPCLLVLVAEGCAPAGDLAEARRLLQSGELGSACRLLDRLLDEPGPREQQLEKLRTSIDCLSRAGRLDRATAWLHERTRSEPLRLYGEALLEVARSPGGLPRAVELLERASPLWPDLGEIPYRAGLLLLADEQPAAALPLLERACRLSATAACAAARAHALLDVGRTDEALQVVTEVPRLQPRAEDVARGRALVQRIARRSAAVPPRAEDRLRRARELAEPRPGEAVRLLEELLVDFPRLAPAHTLLGLAHVRLANMADAVVALRRAAELNPLDAVNPLFLGIIYQTRGRGDEAAQSFREALRLDPFLAGAAQRLAELLLKRGAGREAAEVADQAEAVDGGTPESLRLAGRAHLAAGGLEQAERCYRRLLEREPADYEANLHLARILVGRRARGGPGTEELRRLAARHLDQAAAARPNDPEVELLRLQLR